jgi:GT2 family glycosyltransferase
MLLDQRSSAHEIIVVDQSTDIPAEVKNQLAEWHQNQRIKWIKQKEPNASLARNRGALESTGDVVVFLDDDIEVEKDFIDSYQKVFQQSDILAISGQVLEGNRETVTTLDNRAFDPEIGWLFCKRNYDKEINSSFVMAGNMGVRRLEFLEVGGMDARFMKGAFREEADFGERWRKSGKAIHYRPDVKLFHLGGAGIADGGARHWTRKTYWTGWHHYFGSWYFLINHATLKSLPYLLAIDLRSAGLNKKNLRVPWMVPFHLCRWISALPYALWCKWNGPLLIHTSKR